MHPRTLFRHLPSLRCWLLSLVSWGVANSGYANVDASAPGGLLPPLNAAGERDMDQLAKDLAPIPLKQKMIVMDATVTLDGVARPDLGASFSDTLAAKLLVAGAIEMIDSSALAPAIPTPLEVNNANLDHRGVSTPGPMAALDLGKASGADLVVVPTLINSAGEFRLTLRQLRIPSGKIERILQESFRGDQRHIFALAERVAQQLIPEPTAAEAEVAEPKFSYVRVWMAPPKPEDPLQKEIRSAPRALKGNGSLSAQVAAARAWSGTHTDRREPHRFGQIASVDRDWSFCELTCPPESLQINDQVFAWGGGPLDNLIAMRVSRIQGSRVIAEFDATHPLKHTLRNGLAIYQWKSSTK